MSKKTLHDARKKSDKLGLGTSSWTVWMCVDKKTSKCASSTQMQKSWKHLRRRLKELGKENRIKAISLKAQCVGVCRGGPILAVMPAGIWYGQCTPDVIDRIVNDHLIGGQVVDEYVIANAADLRGRA